jgi:hypothetical protein
MIRIRAPLLALILIAGCLPVVERIEVQPAEPVGPIIVLDVTNGSPEDVDVAYRNEVPAGENGGGGTVPGCMRLSMDLGGVMVVVRIDVDGVEIGQVDVPPDAPKDRFVVVPVFIGVGGEPRLGAPRLAADLPLIDRQLTGCD